MRVESGLWQNRVFSCNHCDCQDIQDEKHVLFYCKDACAYVLRQKYAFLFDGLFATLQTSTNLLKVCFIKLAIKMVLISFYQPNNKLFAYISELMDVLILDGSV